MNSRAGWANDRFEELHFLQPVCNELSSQENREPVKRLSRVKNAQYLCVLISQIYNLEQQFETTGQRGTIQQIVNQLSMSFLAQKIHV